MARSWEEIGNELTDQWINGNRQYVKKQLITHSSGTKQGFLAAYIILQLGIKDAETFLVFIKPYL